MERNVSQDRITHLIHLVYRLVRISLALVFIWSGASKLLAPQSFMIIIDAYGIVPEFLLLPAALMLSSAELVAGIGLLFDIQWTLGVITALLILFMGVLGYGIMLGLDVDCGCFGPEDLEGQAFHSLRPALYRDLVMLAGICFLYYWRYSQSLQPRRLPLISKNHPTGGNKG